MQVSHCTGIRDTRVYNNNFSSWIFSFVRFDTSPKYRMTPGRIGASYQKAISKLDIIVTYWHTIFAQHFFVGSYSTAHTKTGVCVNIICTNKPLDQFVENIVFLRKALSGSIKCHGIRTILCNQRTKDSCSTIQNFIP